MNWQEFFHMGGYAPYVWSSYALAALVLVVNLLMPWLQHRQQLNKLRRQQALEQASQEVRS